MTAFTFFVIFLLKITPNPIKKIRIGITIFPADDIFSPKVGSYTPYFVPGLSFNGESKFTANTFDTIPVKNTPKREFDS